MISHTNGARNFCGRNARARGLHSSGSTCGGFSLLELMVSMAVLVVIAGGVISLISYNENIYARTEQQSDMYENVRAVAELMAQEVGQAGFVDLPAGATLSGAVTASASAQTVAVSSTTSMYVGEILLVDTAASEEPVTLTAVTSTSISAIFANNHASGAVIHAIGVSPNGIVSPSSSATTSGGLSCVTIPTGVTSYTVTDGSTCNVLNIWGDLNSDGSLVYVRYSCNFPSTFGPTTTPGTLTRSVTTITPGVNTVSTAQTLLSTLIQNPPSSAPTPCFQFDISTQQITVNGVTSTYYIVANVGLTISVQTLKPDMTTGQYLTMTKSFLDLSPRNILAGYEQANWGDASRLQNQPPNVALY
jgi:prepilin-type N-terminal cleavage/methylation domain-containing protein